MTKPHSISVPSAPKIVIPAFDEWLLAESPEPDWLIDNFLPAECLAMISGMRKRAHKTWSVLDWAIAIAHGKFPVWHQLKISHPSPRRVAVFEEEGSSPDTRKRLKMLLKAHNLDVDTEEGAANFKTFAPNFRFSHHPRLKLDNPHTVAALCNFVKEEGVEVLVLDAITYMTRGDENSKQDMLPVNDALFAIRSLGCTILYLVHTNKQGQREDSDVDLDVRGSSVLLDAYDAHFALRRRAEDHIHLTARYRDHEETKWKQSWEFKNAAVYSHLSSLDEATVAAESSAVYAQQLLPTIDYTPATFVKDYGLQPREAVKVLNTLVKGGHLVANSRGGFRKRAS